MSKSAHICPTLYPYIVGVPGPRASEWPILAILGNLEGSPEPPISGLRADFGPQGRNRPISGGLADPPKWPISGWGAILGGLADPPILGLPGPDFGGSSRDIEKKRFAD